MPISNGLRCTKCKSVQSLELHTSGLVPTLKAGTIACNNCPGKTFEEVYISPYWFDMAVAFGYPRVISSAALLRDLYEVWPADKYPAFADFMRAEVLA